MWNLLAAWVSLRFDAIGDINSSWVESKNLNVSFSVSPLPLRLASVAVLSTSIESFMRSFGTRRGLFCCTLIE